ncbi:MAG: dephospho-CoA kinase [Oscillospiraceae bacterium]|nr:dephospho-CoA kinase [Oscillospiraceae bacterium]
MKRFYVAVLTGKSGVGKSLAAEYLSAKGVRVIDGDVLAREAVAPNSKCLSMLAARFGEDIILEDGALDRKKLARICFSDEERKKQLDSVIHPFILSLLEDRMDKLRAAGFSYCVVQAPALLESGLDRICDRIVLITAERKTQLERIIERDGLTEEEAKMRLDAQTDEQTISLIADHIIENRGSKEEFFKKLDELVDLFERWFARE